MDKIKRADYNAFTYKQTVIQTPCNYAMHLRDPDIDQAETSITRLRETMLLSDLQCNQHASIDIFIC